LWITSSGWKFELKSYRKECEIEGYKVDYTYIFNIVDRLFNKKLVLKDFQEWKSIVKCINAITR